jgi:hypothetical protein
MSFCTSLRAAIVNKFINVLDLGELWVKTPNYLKTFLPDIMLALKDVKQTF